MLSRTVAPPSPRDHFSFPLSKVSANLLIKLRDLSSYINDEVLTYVINLPLFSRGTSDRFNLVAILIGLENKEYLYIDTRSITMVEKAELYLCKTTTPGSYICLKSLSVMSRHSQETSTVKLFQQS